MIQQHLIRKQRITLLVLTIILLVTAVLSLGLGYSTLGFGRIVPVLMGQGDFKEEFVLYSIRMPRLLITFLAGMALALSGAVLQSITRNDLADPGIIGINSGAGVAIAIFFLFIPVEPGSFAFLMPFVAFLGAFITAILIYLFSRDPRTGLQPVRLVLVGIGFSMALSGVMIVLISSAEREKVDFIAQWLAGSIWGTDWPFILALLPWLIVLITFVLYKSNRLNILGLGESAAIGLGLNIGKERAVLLLAAVALAAAAVSVTGSIAFIGLMAPHLAKALVGPRHQLFLPVAILLGGWLLLAADTIGRNLLEPSGIPAGVMAALIGAPYFVYLLMKK